MLTECGEMDRECLKHARVSRSVIGNMPLVVKTE